MLVVRSHVLKGRTAETLMMWQSKWQHGNISLVTLESRRAVVDFTEWSKTQLNFSISTLYFHPIQSFDPTSH